MQDDTTPPSGGETAAGGEAAEGRTKGGCLSLGWGCLPVLVGAIFLPPLMFL